MKKLTLGLATAVVLLTAAAPAMAQVGFYVGPGGVGVDVGRPYYDDGYYGYPHRYYDYYNGPVWSGDPYWHGHARYEHDWRY